MTARRRVGGALVAAGLVAVVGAGAVVGAWAGSAGADDAPTLGFFDVTAESNGIGATFGDPTSSPYPVAAGLAPHALASLSAGPSGRALSSVLWPGPLVGNAGSLANVIGTPLPPEVVSNANYPVVALAEAGGGGTDEAALGPMHAKVEGADARATTALTDFTAPDVVTAARVLTTSRSHLDGAKAVAVAESDIQGVDVGGVLKIASVRTIARGTSDGVTATTEQDVVLSGVTVADTAATIDREGIHLGDAVVPVGAAVDGAQQALDAFGMTAFVTDPRVQRAEGGAASLDSGSLVIVFSPPDSGQVLTVVLGGSSVTLRATPGSAAGDTGLPLSPSEALPSGSAAGAGGAVGDDGFALPGVGAPRTAGGTTGGGAAPEAGFAPVAAPSLAAAAAVSDRVPFGWVLLGVLGACLVGGGLHTLREQALGAAVAGSRCPLERS